MFRALLLSALAVSMMTACENGKNKSGNLANVDLGQSVDDLSRDDLSGPPARVEGLWQGNATVYVEGQPAIPATISMQIDQNPRSLRVNTAVYRLNGRPLRVLPYVHLQVDDGRLFDQINVRVGDIGAGGFQILRPLIETSFRVADPRGARTASLVLRYNDSGRQVRIVASRLERRDVQRPRNRHNR